MHKHLLLELEAANTSLHLELRAAEQRLLNAAKNKEQDTRFVQDLEADNMRLHQELRDSRAAAEECSQ